MTGKPLTAEQVQDVLDCFPGYDNEVAPPNLGALAVSHELLRARLEQAERERDEAQAKKARLREQRDAAYATTHEAEAALVQARQALQEIAAIEDPTDAYVTKRYDDLRTVADMVAIAAYALAAAGEPGAHE